MKNNTKAAFRLLVVSSGASFLGAFVCSSPAWASLMSDTSALAAFGLDVVSNSDHNPGGSTASSDAFAASGNFARARVGSGGVGVQAETGGSEGRATATARLEDLWVCTAIGVATCTDAVPLKVTFKLDGIIDPLLIDPSFRADTTAQLEFRYDGFGQEFFLGMGFDGQSSGLRAVINGTEDNSGLTIGLNALGETTLTYSYTVLTDAILLSSVADFVSARAAVNNYSSSVAHAFDFFSTFSVDVLSLDSNVQLFSEGGRGAVPPPGVPEPATLLLLSAGLVGLGMAEWRRRRLS